MEISSIKNLNIFMFLAKLQSENKDLALYKQRKTLEDVGFLQTGQDDAVKSWESKNDDIKNLPVKTKTTAIVNALGMLVFGLLALAALLVSWGVGGIAGAALLLALVVSILMLIKEIQVINDDPNGSNINVFSKDFYTSSKGLAPLEEQTEKKKDENRLKTLSDEAEEYQRKADDYRQKIQIMMQTQFSALQDSITSMVNMINQMLSWFGKEGETRN